MSKHFFSMIAAAAFLLSIGTPAAVKAVQQETKWFHVDPITEEIISEAMESPRCADEGPLCSAEYNVDGLDNPTTPTGQQKSGLPY